MKKIIYWLFVAVFINCDGVNKEIRFSNNPYEVLYSKLRDLQVTDTVLVTSEFADFIKKSDSLYMRKNSYGGILSDTILLNRFEKQNKTKIIQVLKENKGNTLVFKDSLLSNHIDLLERLRKEKDFIVFKNALFGMTMSTQVLITNPITKRVSAKCYRAGLKHIGWSIMSVDELLLANQIGDTVFIKNNDIEKFPLGKLTVSNFKKGDTTNFVSKTSGSISCGSITKYSSVIEYKDTLKGIKLGFNSKWYDYDTIRREEKLTEITFDKSKVKFQNGITLNKSSKQEVLSCYEEVDSNEDHFLYIKKENIAYTFIFNEHDILISLNMRYFE